VPVTVKAVINSTVSKSDSLNHAIATYLSHGRTNDAIKCINNAINNSKSASELFYSVQYLRKISDYYFLHNKSDSAYQIIGRIETLGDSLLKIADKRDKEYNHAVNLSSVQKSQIEHLKNEKTEYEHNIKEWSEELEKQKSYTMYSILSLLLFIVMLGLIIYFYKKHLSVMKRLKVYNRQIAQQKEEIEAQKQHLIETNGELEKLSIIARETDNGVRIINETGEVIWINDGYIRMFGYNLDELKTINIHEIYGNDSDIDLSVHINNWYDDKKPISYQAFAKKKNGEQIWIQTSITPILSGGNTIDKIIAIDSDITRIKKAEREIKIKNEDITSSIAYAKRIQEAMLTPFSLFKKTFPESFCYYQPKDIVSGDFYWMGEANNNTVIVCADGTGHGVPGAFISLLGISFLNKVVKEKGYTTPSVILNKLKQNIITHLNQSEDNTASRDGIDMSVISIDKRNKCLEYSGAMNSILIYRDNHFIELQPDKMPVGFFDYENRPFSNTRITLKPNDQVYMYTDGYYDQFGGVKDSKMKTSRFKQILASTTDKPAAEQKEIIENEFQNWKGNKMQVDDVLVIGIKI